MRKKVYYVLSVVIIVIVASINVFNLRTNTVASDLFLENLVALADGGESGELGCGGNPTFTKNESLKSVVCPNGATHLQCMFNRDVCCDPSKQTDCGPAL